MHYKEQVADVNIKIEETWQKQYYISLEVLGCHYIGIFPNIKY